MPSASSEKINAIVARVVPGMCGDFGLIVELDFISEELEEGSFVMQATNQLNY